jgi:hypothetical protein
MTFTTYDDKVGKVTVVGKALYLEFLLDKESEYVQQIVMFPDVVIEGKYYLPSVASRWLAHHSPRGQWRFRGVWSDDKDSLKEFATEASINKWAVDGTPARVFKNYDELNPSSEVEDKVITDFAQIAYEHVFGALFDLYDASQQQIVVRPVAIEVSEHDMREVASRTFPQAVMRRIIRSRKAAGFPEEIIPKPKPTPTSTT